MNRWCISMAPAWIPARTASGRLGGVGAITAVRGRRRSAMKSPGALAPFCACSGARTARRVAMEPAMFSLDILFLSLLCKVAGAWPACTDTRHDARKPLMRETGGEDPGSRHQFTAAQPRWRGGLAPALDSWREKRVRGTRADQGVRPTNPAAQPRWQRGLAPAVDSWRGKRVRGDPRGPGGPPHETGGGHAKHHERTQREADFALRTAIETEVDPAPAVA